MRIAVPFFRIRGAAKQLLSSLPGSQDEPSSLKPAPSAPVHENMLQTLVNPSIETVVKNVWLACFGSPVGLRKKCPSEAMKMLFSAPRGSRAVLSISTERRGNLQQMLTSWKDHGLELPDELRKKLDLTKNTRAELVLNGRKMLETLCFLLIHTADSVHAHCFIGIVPRCSPPRRGQTKAELLHDLPVFPPQPSARRPEGAATNRFLALSRTRSSRPLLRKRLVHALVRPSEKGHMLHVHRMCLSCKRRGPAAFRCQQGSGHAHSNCVGRHMQRASGPISAACSRHAGRHDVQS